VEEDPATDLAEEKPEELPRKEFSDQILFAKDLTSKEKSVSKEKVQKDWETTVKELQLKNVEEDLEDKDAEEKLEKL